MLNLLTWNVNGIRAAVKKDLWSKLDKLTPDLLCVQETKADASVMSTPAVRTDEWAVAFHSCSVKKGYSGVATYYRETASSVFDSALNASLTTSFTTQILQTGLGIEEFDVEGRLIVTKHTLHEPNTPIQDFVILNGYYPQGGRGAHRIEYKIKFYEAVYAYAQSLVANGEHVLICGDLNTTVQDIDLARPAQNRKTTGCLPEERAALNLFLEGGFTDTFRYFHPTQTGAYTYWDQITKARERNVGWRIDYWLVADSLLPYVTDAFILTDVYGSDHAPAGIYLTI